MKICNSIIMAGYTGTYIYILMQINTCTMPSWQVIVVLRTYRTYLLVYRGLCDYAILHQTYVYPSIKVKKKKPV